MNDDRLFCAAAAVLITPPLGTSLGGYFTDRKAEGVFDDLYASILVIQKGSDRIVWIACDLLDFTAEFAFPIRKAIAAQLGMPVCAVWMSATHTHTGPVTYGSLVDQSYLSDISIRIVEAVLAAAHQCKPATLEYGAGFDPRFSFNRRYLMRDGTVMTNPGAHNPEVVRAAGEVDHSLHVIRFRLSEGLYSDRNTLAIVVNCANHADTVDGNLISADWPGALRSKLQESEGKQTPVSRPAPVLVWNGAAGDVNHFDVLNHRAIQNIAEARRIGYGYAETALKVLQQARPLEVNAIKALCKTVPVPYRSISAEELAAAQQVIAELKEDPEARLEGHLESQDIAKGNKAIRLMFAENIVDAARKFQGKTQPLEVAIVQLGPVGIVGINGEVFSEIGIDIRRNSPFPYTLFVALVNGSIGYLGTKKSYTQGGYETLLGERVCDSVEDFIHQGVSELMEHFASSV